MRRRWRIVAGCGVACTLFTVGVSLARALPTDRGAVVSARAERLGGGHPTVRGPITRVAFVGDSLYADYRAITAIPPGYENDTVPLVQLQIDQRLGPGTVSIANHAIAGLTIKYPIPAFTQRALRAEIWHRYGRVAERERPDLVVIGPTGIDIANQARPMVELAPDLVQELRLAVLDLELLGIEALVLPVVPVNEAFFGFFEPAVPGLAHRLDVLDEQLAASDLPLLLTAFDQLDGNRDGVPDAEFYRGYHPVFPDDGVHLNRAGQYVLAGSIGPRLAVVIERANRFSGQ